MTEKIAELLFFVLVIALGYLAVHFRLVPSESASFLPPFLMNICYPALILTSIIHMPLESMLKSGLFSVVATFLITLLLFFLSKYLFRHQPDKRQAQLRFQLGVGNVIYVSIPLLGAILGPEFFFVAIMHAVSQDILIWTLYYPMSLGLASGQSEKTGLRLLKSPCILALILALILRFAGLELPGPVSYTVARLSDMVAPAALVYMGFLLYRYGIFKWARDPIAIKYALVKTVVIPIAVTAILLPLTDVLTAVVLGMLFGSSAPTVSIVWAEGHKGDLPLAINCFLSSTLLHILLTLVAGFLLLKTGVLA